jgi:type IV pilus assembly protein PilB
MGTSIWNKKMRKIRVQNLLDSVVGANLLSQQNARETLQTSLKTQQALSHLLVEKQHVNATELARLFAKEAQLPLLDIKAVNTFDLPTKLIDASLLHKHKLLPLRLKDTELLLAVSTPEALGMLPGLAKSHKLTIKPVVVEYDKLARLLTSQVPKAAATPSMSSANTSAPSGAINNYSKELADSNLDKINYQSQSTEHTDTSEFPVVRFINKIILDSVNRGASDIHFEPYEVQYRIRARIDGQLYELATPDVALAPRLSARIKVMADLDISERRVPQDGRFKINLGNKKTIGFRVNTCPTLFGEKIVMRILDPSTVNVGVDGLGFEDDQKQTFLNAIEHHQGMILVTGPTGSGKTVTLYTALNLLNAPEKNISTAEDPVEIYLPGVNQVNVNTKTGLDFSTVLRAFLRQDPDIIMLGEIRDKETAEIGIKAAQTGHMVLSTLHTNSAAETLTRLENMGTAAYNIATTVTLVIAQRLVRRLCDHCKEPYSLNRAALVKQGFEANEAENLKLHKPVGCEKCNGGFKGRIGIFEMLEMKPEIQALIMDHGSSLDIHRRLEEEGMLTLREAGLNKVRNGMTSLDEINRVTT